MAINPRTTNPATGPTIAPVDSVTPAASWLIVDAIGRTPYYLDGLPLPDDDKQGKIIVYLKYGPRRERVITNIQRVSKPGIRVYKKTTELPRVLNGMGMAIISTPKGLMPDREARRQRLGGEVICTVW